MAAATRRRDASLSHMQKNRLEAFSDGVIAIIITIMVLELKVPHGTDLAALQPLLPVFLSYVLSFVYVGIYWNNHHHLLQATKHGQRRRSCGRTCICCSGCRCVPFVTGWMGENHFAAAADGALRRRAADGGHRLLHSCKAPSSPAGPRLAAGAARSARDWQGQALGVHLRRRDPACVREPMGRRPLYVLVAADVVHPRPPN